MNISKRLRLAVYIPALMALVIFIALGVSYQARDRIQSEGNIVRQMRSSITEINHAVFSYLLYHEERPKQQFLATHELLTEQMDSLKVTDPEEKLLLNSIRDDNEAIHGLFLQLVSSVELGSMAGPTEFQSTEDRLTGLLLVRTYEADINASLLRSLIDNRLTENTIRTIGAVFLSSVLTVIALTIVLMRTRRSINSSLANLKKGTAEIGSGNLSYVIVDKNQDEITDLSRAFNQMTANLNEVTASRSLLEKEISERKQAEDELKQRTAELEVSNKELESFSYSVSHDLRAPLRSMEGFSAALLEDYADKLDDQGKQYLKYVQESSDLMSQLIDDLLKLSRVTRSDMNYDSVNLSEMIQKITAELQKTQPLKNLELIIAPDVSAFGDRNLIRLALENLLANAWKFSGKTASPLIEFGMMEYNNKQVYFIRDNGVGFDMAYVDKLFKPFQRLHQAAEFVGTGIGLATVQRVIRRHGGNVWAEGKVGKGATFYFTLVS